MSKKKIHRIGWGVLVVWVVIIALSAFFAPKLGSVLQAGSSSTPGSESDRAGALMGEELYGADKTEDLLLVISAETVRVADPAFKHEADVLIAEAAKLHGVERISTWWDTGDTRLLGRDERSTFLVVSARVSGDEAEDVLVPALRELAAQAPPGFQVHVTGGAAIGADLVHEAMNAVSKSDLFVVPAVLVILALIFGSLVAGILPLGLGLVSVLVTMALFYFYARVSPTDNTTPAVVSMLGVGVGVDYSLFMVTRFREELAHGRDSWHAMKRTLSTAGKAVAFSGATVIVSVASLLIVNNPLFRSLAIAMMLVVLVAVLVAVTLLPTVLFLLGHRVNSLRIPLPHTKVAASGDGFWRRWAQAVMSRPWLFATVAVVPLLALAYPAAGLNTGWPNVSLLSAKSDARQGYEVLKQQFDEGTMQPISVLVQVKTGTVADAQNLPKIYALTREIKADPAVSGVVSYVSLKDGWDLANYQDLYIDHPAQLADLPGRLSESSSGMAQAVTSLKEIRTGLNTMATRVPDLAAGLQSSSGGTGSIQAGIGQARAGLQQIAAQFSQGARDLEALAQALTQAESLLAQATNDLDAMQPQSKADPKYPAIYQNVATARGILAGGQGHPGTAVAVQTTATSLQTAGAALAQMAGQLSGAEDGLARISGGLTVSSGAVTDTAVSLTKVVDGLDRLIPGLNQAATGLQQAGQEAGQVDLRPVLTRGDFGLRLMMAGGGKAAQDAIPDLVNINRAANVARLMVIPKQGADAPETKALVHRLRTLAPRYTDGLGTILVGGSTAEQLDYNDQIKWALPRVIGLVLLITFVVLLVLLRSILLPLKAIIMNTLSVLAAYGALVLVFEDGFLSGPLGFKPLGYVGSPTIVLLFAVLFGLSMDYEVFLLSRIKEAYDRTGRNEEAVAIGLEQTAGIITGAATIMLVVFATFLVNGMITIKEFGVGLFVAVLLDATLIRIILVPAFMRLMGDWNWWAPAWLLKILPKLEAGH
ncbi:MAG TPA: MMPL family transporter [Symbiobacteriaceae bacterium]